MFNLSDILGEESPDKDKVDDENKDVIYDSTLASSDNYNGRVVRWGSTPRTRVLGGWQLDNPGFDIVRDYMGVDNDNIPRHYIEVRFARPVDKIYTYFIGKK